MMKCVCFARSCAAALGGPTQHRQQRRFFVVDAPVAAESIPIMDASSFTTTPEVGASSGADAAYVYPLDAATQKINLYGEASSYGVDDSNRVISSNRIHSYDSSVLSAELRLQDYSLDEPVHEEGPVAQQSGKDDRSLDENEAVMREGRNKQGAAGAAAVAAAMLESRRAVDGIALVPGHPLPVVFPRPDDLPPPLRFIKKFGPGSGRQTSSNGSSRINSRRIGADEDNNDDGIYSEVMESAAHIESHSLSKSCVFEVRVLDAQQRPAKVKGLHHFQELADVLPAFVQRGLADANFGSPTLMQSATLPLLMTGKDLLCVAPPTSGRTYSIAIQSLTVLEMVLQKETRSPPAIDTNVGIVSAKEKKKMAMPVVLVVCPSRETARRMSSAYHILAGEEVNIQAIFMSKEESKQDAELVEGHCQVLLATPKRLVDVLRRGLVSLAQVHFAAVFDVNKIVADVEAATALETVMDGVKKNAVPHQISIWCDDLSKGVEQVAERYLASGHANTVVVKKEEQFNANVRHVLYALKSKEERIDCIWKLYDSRAILKREQVVIFCLFKETAEQVAEMLTTKLEAPSSLIQFLHSGLRRKKQVEILRSFQRGDSRILVTTDVGVKKIDVPDLEHVINFDLAPTTELLARRFSIVGRSGRVGTVHIFLTPNDSAVPITAKFISEQTGKELSPEISEIVARTEASGGADSWSTPLIRFNDHVGLTTRWRVRGQLDDPARPVSDRAKAVGRRHREKLVLSRAKKV